MKKVENWQMLSKNNALHETALSTTFSGLHRKVFFCFYLAIFYGPLAVQIEFRTAQDKGKTKESGGQKFPVSQEVKKARRPEGQKPSFRPRQITIEFSRSHQSEPEDSKNLFWDPGPHRKVVTKNGRHPAYAHAN